MDSAFEIKTMCLKLTRLADAGRTAAVGGALAERRAAARGAAFGFLYVDGNVRVYYGQRKAGEEYCCRPFRVTGCSSSG